MPSTTLIKPKNKWENIQLFSTMTKYLRSWNSMSRKIIRIANKINPQSLNDVPKINIMNAKQEEV